MMHAKFLPWLTIYIQYLEKNPIPYFGCHCFIVENFLNQNKKLKYAVCIFNTCLHYYFLCINNCTFNHFYQSFGLSSLPLSVLNRFAPCFWRVSERTLQNMPLILYEIRFWPNHCYSIHLDIHLSCFWTTPAFIQCLGSISLQASIL